MYLPDPRDLSLDQVELINTLKGFRAVVDGLIRGDLLTGIGLSLFYHAPTNSHWIGKHDPRVSDHDRWYFVRKPKGGHASDAIWWHVFPERQYTPGSNGQTPARKTPRTVLLPKDLKRELENLNHEVDRVNKARSIGWKVQELPAAEILTQLRLFGPASAGLLHPIYQTGRIQDPSLLHELIYHYPTWAAANDAVGMPQDLSLRMHGYAHVIPYLPRLLQRP